MSNFEFISGQDKELVHKKSLEILEKAGIMVESRKILEKLELCGCPVDYEKHRVTFPPSLVEESLRLCPSTFILGGLTEEYDMYLGIGNTYISTDTQGCFTADLETGERHTSLMQDLVDGARVSDALDYIHSFCPLVVANDVLESMRTVREMTEIFQVSSKHVQSDCYNESQAVCYKEVLTELFQAEQLNDRPPFSLVCCPISPLTFEASMLEGTIILGDLNVPVLILPMPMSGTTAPMSLFATLIQNNTEMLASITILQQFHPGRKIIYGSSPGVMDMKTLHCCVGAPEGALVNAACAQMAKLYHLPSFACNGVDSHLPDEQMGAERGSTNVALFMSGADIICGVGLTSSAMCLYLEELVMDEDILKMSRRIAEGIRTGEEHCLTEEVLEVGPGGNFLYEESTLEYLKNGEHYAPKIFRRVPFHEGIHSNPTEIAKDRVREILSAPKKQNFSIETIEKVYRIIEKAEQKN